MHSEIVQNYCLLLLHNVQYILKLSAKPVWLPKLQPFSLTEKKLEYGINGKNQGRGRGLKAVSLCALLISSQSSAFCLEDDIKVDAVEQIPWQLLL